VKFFGKGSPIQLYCSQANVNTHHKLKAKLKSSIESGTDLEYTDPETNATAKLSDDDIFEINAFQPFKAAMQNETGPKRTHQVDITRFFSNDFTSYLGDYDPDDPDEYEYCMAKAALATATHEANKLHEAQMKQLASTTANAMTAGGTTDTTSSSGGSSSGGGVIPTIDPLAMKKKALKKTETPDYNAYTPFKNDDDFLSWWKAFVNTATLHGFKNQLDPTYVPITADEKEIFVLRQKHLYAILNKILPTSKSLDLLRDHISDTNAQKVLSELQKHQTDSILATRRGRECLQSILTARMDPNRPRS
jgi:hypothetical protein